MGVKAKIRNSVLAVVAKPPMKLIMKLERRLHKDKRTFKPATNSPKRFEILFEMLKSQSDDVKLPGFPFTIPIIGGSILDIIRILKTAEKGFANTRKEINSEELQFFESYARKSGISSIGYTNIPNEYIFKNNGILYNKAIVITMPMDKEKINTSPSLEAGVTVHKTYNRLGKISIKLSKFLRKKGFQAQAGHPLMGQTLYPALAELAGIGYHGKHGLIITPENGPVLRIAVIYTSISNLPINRENKHKWIIDYCERCNLCAKKCPANAFYDSIQQNNGFIKCVDSDKCFVKFSELHGCSICLKVCPFNKVGYDALLKNYSKRQNKSYVLNAKPVGSLS